MDLLLLLWTCYWDLFKKKDHKTHFWSFENYSWYCPFLHIKPEDTFHLDFEVILEYFFFGKRFCFLLLAIGNYNHPVDMFIWLGGSALQHVTLPSFFYNSTPLSVFLHGILNLLIFIIMVLLYLCSFESSFEYIWWYSCPIWTT